MWRGLDVKRVLSWRDRERSHVGEVVESQRVGSGRHSPVATLSAAKVARQSALAHDQVAGRYNYNLKLQYSPLHTLHIYAIGLH